MPTSDYSDQSGDEISEVSSTRITPGPPIPQDGAIERLHTRNGTWQFLVVDYSANHRCGSKTSAIWDHGGERRRLDDNSMDRYWRCAYCRVTTILKVKEGGKGGQTSYAIRHLKNKHKKKRKADEVEEAEDTPGCLIGNADY
jgi:hypothetical protein